MYICTQCKNVFEDWELETVHENHGSCFGFPAVESFSVCPVCKGEYEEAVKCSICEEYHLEEDLTNGICDYCLDNEVDYDKALKFLLSQEELKYFVFKFFFTEKTFGGNLDKAITEELTWWFKRKVFDEKLNNKTEFLDILKKYMKTDPYGWSEFLNEGEN
jgi:hypothetical protein